MDVMQNNNWFANRLETRPIKPSGSLPSTTGTILVQVSNVTLLPEVFVTFRVLGLRLSHETAAKVLAGFFQIAS